MRPFLAFLLMAAVGNFCAAYAQEVVTSGADQQIAVQVTVYNSNVALVKERRKLDLPKGPGELRFTEVAAHIKPTTVLVKSATQPDRFHVLEQNYEYDLISAARLLDKYVGKRIKIVDWNHYQDRKQTVDAELLSNNEGPVYRINDEIYLGHPGYQVLPKLPENLIAKPTLMWVFENNGSPSHEIEASYLTENISWRADYVLALDKDDRSADLSGWVSVENGSGASYKNAQLKLVAGEVHRVEEYARRGKFKERSDSRAQAAASQFEEKPFFEYHLYDLQRPTTLKDKQTKQIRLLDVYGVNIHKEFLVYGIQSQYARLYREETPRQPVSIYVTFKNSKDNKVGMPLPEGVMRLYKADDKGSLQFIGEDRVKHTPRDEDVRLKIGNAFDVVAQRTQKDFKQLTTRSFESQWEIAVRNHKDQDVTVGVIEPLFSQWEILEKSHPFKKIDAHTIRFDVQVPKNGETKITYRVRVGL
ncbi:MAG: DUF4139 domain-containing protein [Desulfomonilaceae bacterium]